jgi:hypothetical protein
MQGLAGAPTTTRICLQPFTAQETAALVAHTFEGTAAPAAFLAQVLLPDHADSQQEVCCRATCEHLRGACCVTSRRGDWCLVQAAAAIHERSCGLPLFIQEMAVHLRQARLQWKSQNAQLPARRVVDR